MSDFPTAGVKGITLCYTYASKLAVNFTVLTMCPISINAFPCSMFDFLFSFSRSCHNLSFKLALVENK